MLPACTRRLRLWKPRAAVLPGTACLRCLRDGQRRGGYINLHTGPRCRIVDLQFVAQDEHMGRGLNAQPHLIA